MEITDEVRQAVRREDCTERGHLINPNTALAPTGHGGTLVVGPPGQQPHLSCRNCGAVWLVSPDAHADYQAATRA